MTLHKEAWVKYRKHTEKKTKLKVGKMMSHLHASPCDIGTEFSLSMFLKYAKEKNQHNEEMAGYECNLYPAEEEKVFFWKRL